MPVFNNILIIDDNQIDLVIARAVIRNHRPGATIITHNSPEQAFQHLSTENKNRPDLILLDIDMPKLCGLKFMSKLSEDPSFDPDKTAVYFLTANTDTSVYEKAANIEGVQGLLSKPLTTELFAGLVEGSTKSNTKAS
jgi:CheY-like chemotaxis protein